MTQPITAEAILRLSEWAATNESVASLWLFGSRAKGTFSTESDYDIALELMPMANGTDWAFANVVIHYREWKDELRALLASEVSLVTFRDDQPMAFDPRDHGRLLWSRFT